MESRVPLFGHSLSRTVVFLPLGLFACSAGADVLYFATRDTTWALIGYRLISAGLVSALVVALIGFIDWLAIPQTARGFRVGRARGVGNMVVVTLFILSWYLRQGELHIPAGSAVAFSLLGLTLIVGTAWLAKALVSRRGVGGPDPARLAPSSALQTERPGVQSEHRG